MKIRIILMLVVVLLLSGCAKTEVLNVWVDEAVTPQKLNKFFVVGLGKETAYRKILEQKMVTELKRNGVEAISLYSVFGDRLDIEEVEAIAAIKEHGVDGVILIQLIGSDKKEVYTPGMTVVTSTAYNSGWYGYYGGGYQAYRTPGRTYNYREATVETVIFTLGSKEPVWSVLTRTTEEKKFEVIEAYIKGVHKTLLKSGYL